MIKKLLYINIILAIVLNWFTKNPDILRYGFSYLGLLPKQVFGLVEVISILIFLFILPYISKKKEFVYPLIILAGVLVISLPYTLFWDGKIVHFVLGVRSYASFVPIFYGGYYLSIKGYSIKPYTSLILILCFIQLPVTLFQYLFSLSIVTNIGTKYDVISGTMGGIAGNLMSVLLTSVALVLIYFYFQNKKKWLLLGVVALIIPSILAEAKGVFVILFIGVVYFLLVGKIKVSKKIGLILGSAIMFALLVAMYINFVDLERDVWDPSYYIEYENKKNLRIDGRVARHTSIVLAFELIASNPPGLLFGLGLGNASLNSLVGSNGPYYSFNTILHFWDRFIIETGLLGVFIMFYMTWKSIMMLKYLERNSNDKFIATIAGGMAVVMLVGIISGLYIDHFNRVQYSYPLSLILGYLYSEYRKIKILKTKALLV